MFKKINKTFFFEKKESKRKEKSRSMFRAPWISDNSQVSQIALISIYSCFMLLETKALNSLHFYTLYSI